MSKGPPFPHQPPYQPQFPPQPQVVIVQQAGPPQSQALPALVNFFCFPGLGQLIQGRAIAALVWYLASIAAAASVFLFCIGFIAYPLVVILSVIDAARYDPREHQGESANPALIAVGVLAMLIGIPLVGFMGLTAIGFLAAPSHVAHEGGTGTVAPAGTSEPKAGDDPAVIDLGPGPPEVDPANEAQYTIITDEPFRNIKRSVDVRLDRRINADELQRIAEKIKAKDPATYQRTFITYSLPWMKPGAGAWATTHYNPDLKVEILGLTADDEKNLMPTPQELTRDIVGCWLDDSIGSPHRVVVYRSQGQTFLETVYPDKSRGTKPLVERREGDIQKFFRKDHESETGDHWRINSDGDLESWDNDGLIQRAKNVPLPANPMPPVVGAAESPPSTASETPAGTEKPSAKEPDVTTIGPLRTWRAAEGNFKVEAKLVAINAEKVTLQKLDGSTIEVPLEKLSDLDQRYATREAAKAAKTKQ